MMYIYMIHIYIYIYDHIYHHNPNMTYVYQDLISVSLGSSFPRRPANHLVTHQRYEAKAPVQQRRSQGWAVAKGDFVRGSCRLVLDASLARGDPAAVMTLKGKELWERAAGRRYRWRWLRNRGLKAVPRPLQVVERCLFKEK